MLRHNSTLAIDFFSEKSSDQMYVSENKVVVPSMVLDSENGRQFKINKSQSSKMFMNLKLFIYLKKVQKF